MEVEKLDINAGPVNQIGSSSVLARRPIVGKPSPTRKLTMSLENQQLVLAEVLPAMRKVSTNMKVEKASTHDAISSMQRLNFLGPEVNTERPSNNSCGSGSVSTMLVDKSSSSSTNFPDTIWVTIFAGIGENPGPTTNGS